MTVNSQPKLDDCLEFRQTLLARPPALVHGTVLLLTALLSSALSWAAWTQADLVVRAGGRIRPVSTPKRVVCAARGESLSASVGGKVTAVGFREGDEVHRGDVLVRLDTAHLDNDIARRKQTIRTGEEELAKLARLEELLAGQAAAGRAKGAADLAQALDEARLAKERQEADVRLARVDVDSAADELARTAQLARVRAAPQAELVKAQSRYAEAREKLKKAELPVDDHKVQAVREALVLADRDAALRGQELKIRREQKRGEVETSRLELANLELERSQAVLCAPSDGIVTAGDVKVGDVLEAGKLVAEIAEQKGFRFEAAVASEDVAHLRAGMPARLKLDAFDYQRYGTVAGTVSFISPDSGLAEGQQRAVYVVRIEVQGNEVGRGEWYGEIKLGMAGQVEIVTSRESILSLLTKKIRQVISLG
jgi:multidrug resistance efflux pump